MQTRKATPEDADAVYALVCEMRKNPPPRPSFDALYNSAMIAPHRYIVYATDGAVPVGFAEFEMQTTLAACMAVGTVHDLYVTPDFRGRNVGTGMLIFLTSFAKQLGCSVLQTTISRVNLRSESFLERNGFHKSRNLFLRELLK